MCPALTLVGFIFCFYFVVAVFEIYNLLFHPYILRTMFYSFILFFSWESDQGYLTTN